MWHLAKAYATALEPPIGASANTWANIYKNKQRIDYCVDQFAYLTNRVKCVQKFTVGPFLA